MYIEDFWISQLVDNRTDPFEMDWNKNVINILGKDAGCPFLFPFVTSDVEFLDWMAVEACIVSVK